MNVKSIFLAATVILALSCSRGERITEEVVPAETPTVQLSDAEVQVLHQMRGDNNRISLDEAMELALSAAGSPSGGGSLTKSRAVRRISSVKVLRTGADGSGSRLTKSAGGGDLVLPDTVAYVFNFDGEGGFAIVAADTRVESPLLAFCDHGELGDTIDNPGLALFLEGAAYYMEKSIAESQRLRDSLLADILAKIEENGVSDTIYHSDNPITSATNVVQIKCDETPHVSTTYGAWENVEHVGPLLPVEWNQKFPYNDKISTICSDGNRAVAGCVSIAVAHLIAYWKHPTNLNGMTFDWDMLRNYTAIPYRYSGVGSKIHIGLFDDEAIRFRTQVSHLVWSIGENIGTDYGCGENGSGAKVNNAIEFLNRIGYTCGSGQGYDCSTVVNSLNQSKPVLIRGDALKIVTKKFFGLISKTSYDKGHAWLIDGYLKRRRLVTVTTTVYRNGLPRPIIERSVLAKKLVNPPRPFCIRTTSTTTYYENSPFYLHNNWGWEMLPVGTYSNGNTRYHNGYYLAGCFNAIPGADVPSNTLTKTYGQDFNFQYNISIFPYISK